MKLIAATLLCIPLLTGCDQLRERMGIPDAAKLEEEGKAIGSACRHAGRGLEDCFRLNHRSSKAAIFAGWKEMNEYMIKNDMQAVPPQLTPDAQPGRAPAKPVADRGVADKETGGAAETKAAPGKETKAAGDDAGSKTKKDAGR